MRFGLRRIRSSFSSIEKSGTLVGVPLREIAVMCERDQSGL